MGISSSQCRLLMLTSRLSDIELEQILLSQRQNRLAFDQEKVAKTYSDALSNYKLMVKVPDLQGKSETSTNAVNLSHENLNLAGFVIADEQGNLYLNKDENGNWKVPKDIYGRDLLTLNGDGTAYVNEKKLQDDGSTTPHNGKAYTIVDGGEILKKPDVLEQQILNGRLYAVNTTDDTMGLTPEMLQSDLAVEWVLDTSDDAQALSVYEYETSQLERKENQIEMEIKQLETQHEAINKEIESVDKVISGNIERTFKLFSDG